MKQDDTNPQGERDEPVASNNEEIKESPEVEVTAEADPVQVYGMDVVEVRGMLVKILLGCLIAAAGVAVLAILLGSMTDTVWRAIWTIFIAAVHILIIFGIISMSTHSQAKERQRSTDFFVNATITIVIFSFFTALLNAWDVLPFEVAWRLYMTYIVLFVGLLHVKVLMDVESLYSKVRPYLQANYIFIALVSVLILGVVYFNEVAVELLGGFYGRLLAAAAVVDVTLSIIIAVLQRLHVQKHPELYEDAHFAQFSTGRIIVFLLLMFIIGWPILSFLLSSSRFTH